MLISLVAPGGQCHVLELELLFDQFRFAGVTGPNPGCDMGEVLVVSEGFPFVCLVFLTEMATTGFIPRHRIETHHLRQFEEVVDPTGPLQCLIELLACPQDFHVRLELFV